RHDVARVYPDVIAVDTEFPMDANLLAEDGYHPGPAACAWWAEALARQMQSRPSANGQVSDALRVDANPDRVTREDR
ncbi:MAG: hypothetical protein AAGJ86_10880, partial [Pseudomonadota bacterium]